MTAQRPSNSERTGTYTALAGGSLGTAANLEDTQVYQLEDLQVPAPAPAHEPVVAQEPAVARPPAPEQAPCRPASRSVRQRAPRAPSRAAPGGAIAAAVLATVIGGAALLAFANRDAGTGAGLGADVPTAGTSAEPVTQAPADGGGGGRGGGGNVGGGGNGNGGGNGGGNGNGNGGGNGRGG